MFSARALGVCVTVNAMSLRGTDFVKFNDAGFIALKYIEEMGKDYPESKDLNEIIDELNNGYIENLKRGTKVETLNNENKLLTRYVRYLQRKNRKLAQNSHQGLAGNHWLRRKQTDLLLLGLYALKNTLPFNLLDRAFCTISSPVMAVRCGGR